MDFLIWYWVNTNIDIKCKISRLYRWSKIQDFSTDEVKFKMFLWSTMSLQIGA